MGLGDASAQRVYANVALVSGCMGYAILLCMLFLAIESRSLRALVKHEFGNPTSLADDYALVLKMFGGMDLTYRVRNGPAGGKEK